MSNSSYMTTSDSERTSEEKGIGKKTKLKNRTKEGNEGIKMAMMNYFDFSLLLKIGLPLFLVVFIPPMFLFVYSSCKQMARMEEDINELRFRKNSLLEPGHTITDAFRSTASSNYDANWNVDKLSIFNDVHCYHPHNTQGGGYDKVEVTIFPNVEQEVTIKGIVVRGRRDADQYTKEGDIYGSYDGVKFEHLGRMKFCENHRDMNYIYFREPAKYTAIRIVPSNYFVVPVLNVGLIV